MECEDNIHDWEHSSWGVIKKSPPIGNVLSIETMNLTASAYIIKKIRRRVMNKEKGILPFEEKARKIIAKAMTEYDQEKKGLIDAANDAAKEISKLHYKEIEEMYEVYTLTKNLISDL